MEEFLLKKPNSIGKQISFDPCMTVVIVLNLQKALINKIHLKNRIHVTAFSQPLSMLFEPRYRPKLGFLDKKILMKEFFPLSDVAETNCTSQTFSKFSQKAKIFETKTTKNQLKSFSASGRQFCSHP